MAEHETFAMLKSKFAAVVGFSKKQFLRTFAHEAEQLLRNIPHISASHTTRFVHICAICAKIKNCPNCFFSRNKFTQWKDNFSFRSVINCANVLQTKTLLCSWFGAKHKTCAVFMSKCWAHMKGKGKMF